MGLACPTTRTNAVGWIRRSPNPTHNRTTKGHHERQTAPPRRPPRRLCHHPAQPATRPRAKRHPQRLDVPEQRPRHKEPPRMVARLRQRRPRPTHHARPRPQSKPCRRGLCLAKKPHRAGKQRGQPGRRLQRRRERQRRAQPQPRRPQQPKLRQQPRHQLPGRPLGQTAPCQRQRSLGKPGDRRRPARHPLKPHRRHHQPIPANRFNQRPTGAERRLPQKRRTNPRPHPHQSPRR